MSIMNTHLKGELLSAYLDHELRPEEAQRIDLHLATCPDCRERLERLEFVATRLRGVRPVAPPPVLDELVLGRLPRRAPRTLAERIEARRNRPRLRSQIGWLFVVVLSLAVLELLFAEHLERRDLLRQRAEEARAMAEHRLEQGPAARAQLGERIFGFHGVAWIEEGIELGAGFEAGSSVVEERGDGPPPYTAEIAAARLAAWRSVSLDSLEGQEVLDALPGLAQFLAQQRAPVVVSWQGAPLVIRALAGPNGSFN